MWQSKLLGSIRRPLPPGACPQGTGSAQGPLTVTGWTALLQGLAAVPETWMGDGICSLRQFVNSDRDPV